MSYLTGSVTLFFLTVCCWLFHSLLLSRNTSLTDMLYSTDSVDRVV